MWSYIGASDSNSKNLAILGFCLLDPAQDPFGRCGQLIYMDTERFQGVVDGLRHCGRGYHAAPFPATLYPVYRVRGRRLVMPEDHLGNLHGGRDQVVLVAGVRQSTLFVVDELLEERGADPLGGATDYLAGQRTWVHHGAAIVHRRVLRNSTRPVSTSTSTTTMW